MRGAPSPPGPAARSLGLAARPSSLFLYHSGLFVSRRLLGLPKHMLPSKPDTQKGHRGLGRFSLHRSLGRRVRRPDALARPLFPRTEARPLAQRLGRGPGPTPPAPSHTATTFLQLALLQPPPPCRPSGAGAGPASGPWRWPRPLLETGTDGSLTWDKGRGSLGKMLPPPGSSSQQLWPLPLGARGLQTAQASWECHRN